ncbi:MAG: peptidoglycan DD-metalloendopeptidase family protein [Patescibacteria group bacterium]|nr:M23 family metallopeptidase [Patescibacteria group bacterium]MDE1966846.1 peptidoglycan DD-metalloendopeptidase family protein [Patescibacteria group bacterium]
MKSKLKKGKKNSQSFTRAIALAAFVLLCFGVIASSSETAHASLVSFMDSLFGSEQAAASDAASGPQLNSENIALLQAHANIDPTADVSADSVPVSEDALVPSLAASNSTSTDGQSATISTYVVRPGDTISGVAKMFDVSVNTVLWANDLNGKSILKPGQTLIILPISGITYTVKKGDTLESIAKALHADPGDISSYNDLSPSAALQAGQSLIIPNAELSTPVPSAPTYRHGRITKAPYEPLLVDVSKLPYYPGYYIRPIVGGYKSQGLHGHNAVDLAGVPIGTPIHAAASGEVIIARSNGAWNGGYGNYVVISHPNGTQTLYAHMLRTAVSPGERVTQGQTIGYIGMTGLTTGPHVHFEIRGAVNPF